MKYCNKCNWLVFCDSEYELKYYCESPTNKVTKRNAFHEWEDYKQEPEKKNSHNNCHDYMERKSLWTKLKNFVLAYFR